MKLLFLPLAGFGLVVAAVAAVVVAVGSGAGTGVAATTPQSLVIRIAGTAKGEHVEGSNLVVRSGQPVEVTIVNESPLAHTFTIRALGIDKVVLPGSMGRPTTTTVTFTAKRGVYTWKCSIPCGGMEAGHMGGQIYSMRKPITVHGPNWAPAA